MYAAVLVKDRVVDFDQKYVGGNYVERLRDLVPQIPVVRSIGPGCERIEHVILVAGMGPDSIQDGARTVLPTKHYIGCQTRQGEFIPFRKSVIGGKVIPILHDPEILIAAPCEKQLCVDLQ